MTLRFSTNGPGFDFPNFEGTPGVRYVIASTPRCGSNFLQRALWRSQRAGAPEEYLTSSYIQDFNERAGADWATSAPGEDRASYIEFLWQHRSSPNGVFGLKLHGSHLSAAIDEHGNLLRPLQGSKWLWIRRRNQIAQAVSYLRADQTGIWIVDGEWLPTRAPLGEPTYDYCDIEARLQQVASEEVAWNSFFAAERLDVHVVWYEDLGEMYSAELSEVFTFLGISPSGSFPPPGISRQADETNELWERAFRSGRKNLD